MNRTLLTAISVATLLFSSAAFAEHNDDDDAGTVYAMTNAPDNNQIIVFDRNEHGMLKKSGAVSTHGKGSGGGLDPLASQGSLTLSDDQHWLLAANAGSQDVSVFRVFHDELNFIDKAGIGQATPVSIAVFHDLVYVLGTGAVTGTSASISGFKLSHSGHLTPLANSIRLLGAGAYSQIGFDPRGERLVVTDRAGNRILIYALDNNGRPATNPVISASSGMAPFGLAFDRHEHLLTVEAASNTVSSYSIRQDETLQSISPLVANGQKASCWIASNGRRFAFTTNPGTQSLSSFRLSAGTGQVTLIAGVAGAGNKPLDLATTGDGRFVYALDPGSNSIDAFEVDHEGNLTNLGPVSGDFATYAQGIAVR